MKAKRLLMTAVIALVAGCLAYGQTEFAGNAELRLAFSPENPSMSDTRLEVRVFADLEPVTSPSGDPLLSSYLVPVGFDPSYVRLVSAEPGQAQGFSAAEFAATEAAIANARGFVTLMNKRAGSEGAEPQVELGLLVFELLRPGNAVFTTGSGRTVRQGTLAAIPEGSTTQPQRLSWSGQTYTLAIRKGLSDLPSLLCPSWFSVSDMYQGLALLNEGSDAASLRIYGWGADGALVSTSSSTNPAGPIDLPALNQDAKLVSQYLNIPESVNVEHGWIEIKPSTPDVSGFFIQGVNTQQGTQQMDGIKMTYSPASRFIFPLIQNAGRVPEIAVTNPETTAVNAEIRVLNASGQAIRTSQARIAAHGSWVQEIPEATDEQAVYVEVQGQRPLTAVERFGSAQSIALLDGQNVELASTRLSAPQFASGFLGGAMRMETYFALVNPSAGSTTAIIRLLDETGKELAAPAVRNMGPGALLFVGGADLFGLPDPQTTSRLTVGTVVVESDTGLIGAQSFGDPVNGKYLASLPLLSTSSAKRELYFGHVAVGILDKVDYFTGIALVNPSPADSANITLELHDADGKLLASTSTPYSLAPGSRMARLMQELIPNFPSKQFGGYIRLISDKEVYGYILIGDNFYNFLSAVP